MVARHQGHTGFFHQLFGRRFESHGFNSRDTGTDEHQAGAGTRIRKICVFTQKTITGVNRLRTGLQCRIQNALPLQITVLHRRAANMHRFVASLHMRSLSVCVGIHSDSAHAHALSGGGDAAGDLAPVGNQYFVEHGISSAWPLLQASPRWHRRQWPAPAHHATSAQSVLHAYSPCRPRIANNRQPLHSPNRR